MGRPDAPMQVGPGRRRRRRTVVRVGPGQKLRFNKWFEPIGLQVQTGHGKPFFAYSSHFRLLGNYIYCIILYIYIYTLLITKNTATPTRTPMANRSPWYPLQTERDRPCHCFVLDTLGDILAPCTPLLNRLGPATVAAVWPCWVGHRRGGLPAAPCAAAPGGAGALSRAGDLSGAGSAEIPGEDVSGGSVQVCRDHGWKRKRQNPWNSTCT